MVQRRAVQRISVAEAVDRFIDHATGRVQTGTLAAATRDNYAADLRDVCELLGERTVLDDVTGDMVDQMMVRFASIPDRRRTRHPRDREGRPDRTYTLLRFWNSTAALFTYAERMRWVDLSPMPDATRPRVKSGALRVERTALAPAQAVALLEHGAGAGPAAGGRPHEDNWARDRFLLGVLMVLGPRVSEVVAANVADWVPRTELDGTVQWYWRIRGKGGKVRQVPLSPWLMALFHVYQATRPDPPVDADERVREDAVRALVVTGRGTRLTARDVQRMLARAVARVRQAEPGLARDVTPHGLRHTCATVHLSAGWTVKQVQTLLGHEDLSTVSRYVDELPGELVAAIGSSPLQISADTPEGT